MAPPRRGNVVMHILQHGTCHALTRLYSPFFACLPPTPYQRARNCSRSWECFPGARMWRGMSIAATQSLEGPMVTAHLSSLALAAIVSIGLASAHVDGDRATQ